MFRRTGFFKSPRQFDDINIGEENGIRSLFLGSPTIQSSMRLTRPFDLVLDYTKTMMAFMLFLPKFNKVACIGLGGGSIPKFLWKYFPHVDVTTVEINERIISIAHNYFDVPESDNRFRVIHANASDWIQSDDQYDVIFLDAFDGLGVPSDLIEDRFIDDVAGSLTEDGVYIQNLWASDPNFTERVEQVERHFSNTLLIPSEKRGNVSAIGFIKPQKKFYKTKLLELAGELDKRYDLNFKKMVTSFNDYDSLLSKKIDI